MPFKSIIIIIGKIPIFIINRPGFYFTVVKYTYGSDEMWALVAKSKFNSMPLFAKASEGHIGLQGDHGEIWYRNIRIRKL